MTSFCANDESVIVTGNSSQWILRKHADGENFGPVPFDQIRDWALSARIHPQDSLSNDGRTWHKATMLEELKMDWIVEVTDQFLYGPTTAGTLLEFLKLGEISSESKIINCCTGETMLLSEVSFFPSPSPRVVVLKDSLQNRVLELEASLLHKQTELRFALDKIDRLEKRLANLSSGRD